MVVSQPGRTWDRDSSSERLPQATMSGTSDERLGQTPTAEVQGLRGDIGDSPSIREVSRSVRSSSRNREPASNVEQSPAQYVEQLLRGRQLANQQGVSATTGDSVQMINTPVNQTSLTNMGTVPVGRRTASRTASSFGSTATGVSEQSGMLSESRASTRRSLQQHLRWNDDRMRFK